MSTTALVNLHQQARQALRGGNPGQALGLLWQALEKTTAREPEYRAMLTDLRGLLVQQRMTRAALAIDWYRGDGEAQRQLLDGVPASDRARTLESWATAERDPNRVPKRWLRAAEVYEEAEQPARAAVCRERARDFEHARALWARLSTALASDGKDRYAAALARFNLARCCKALGDKSGAHQAVVGSVHLLEEAADRYEQIGQRERAFDCYQVLLAIGKESAEFEHVLEGIVNAVRILREDHLRYYALQEYEEAIGLAKERGEFTAGATLANEMAQYATAQGMAQLAAYGTRTAAEMWQAVAKSATDKGLPPELSENAMLASITSFARQGQFSLVGKLYERLSELDLDEARKKAYARSARRYVAAQDAAYDGAPLPSHLRQDTSYPDVWHVDSIEWEQQGRASDACGDVVLDSEHNSEIIRRRALAARLAALDVEAQGDKATPAAQVRLCELLGQVELYAILAPLEALFRAPAPEVRVAVVRALERFMYKRSFVTVRAALADTEAGVRTQAYHTLEALRFAHAFDPLARVVREASDVEARKAAIRAIARIDTNEAAEMVLGVLQHEGQAERAAAVESLKKGRGATFGQVARSAWNALPVPVQGAVREVLAARGEAT